MCQKAGECFRSSGILCRKQWKVWGIPDQQTCARDIEKHMLHGEEEFIPTEEGRKCFRSDRPVTWFLWYWVKEKWKSILKDHRHEPSSKENMWSYQEIICTPFQKSWVKNALSHTIPGMWFFPLFLSTTAFTNISESNWCHFDPPEFLLEIHFISGNNNIWTGIPSSVSSERNSVCTHQNLLETQTSMRQLEMMENLSKLYSSKPNGYCRHTHSSPVYTV